MMHMTDTQKTHGRHKADTWQTQNTHGRHMADTWQTPGRHGRHMAYEEDTW